MNIYCDESGYTGDNLLDQNSNYFVYSSIAIEPDEARSLVEQIVSKSSVNGELKGTKLVRTSRGRQGIEFLLSECLDRTQLVFFDKKYSLAGKFYQYIFDDVLSEDGWLFYEIGFNRFISNVLFVAFNARDEQAETILSDFQNLMRAQGVEGLKQLFFADTSDHPVLEQILTFCSLHKETILNELDPLLTGEVGGKWLLDLTYTALSGLLAYWGGKFESLEVYCDESKPLLAQPDFFNWAIDYRRKSYLTLRGEQFPITFNLSRPIQTVRSKECPGIQLADVIASSFCHCINHRNEEYSESLFKAMWPAIHPTSIIPDEDDIDLTQKMPFVNSSLLIELVDRSKSGVDLSAGIREFIMGAMAIYPEYRKELNI